MATGRNASRAERLAEFLRRLAAAPCSSSEPEGFIQISDIMNAVEDKMTDIPNDPSNSEHDGRMYPPLLDTMRVLPGALVVKKYRVRKHDVKIGENGAIEIRERHSGLLILSKPGGDGKKIP